ARRSVPRCLVTLSTLKGWNARGPGPAEPRVIIAEQGPNATAGPTFRPGLGARKVQIGEASMSRAAGSTAGVSKPHRRAVMSTMGEDEVVRAITTPNYIQA